MDKLSNAELIKNDKVIERIQQEVDAFNVDFGSWEKIKKFQLMPTEFTIEGEELTPTLKFKRKIIMKKYHDVVEHIYRD